MKTRSIVFGLVVACLAGPVMAQENDDMYFNAKDRAKLNAEKEKETPAITANIKAQDTQALNEEEEFSATESYSTRNTNPEYTSRSSSEVASSDNGDYFVSGYQYTTAQNLDRFNTNYSNWYNNPWYTNGYYASAMYGWNRPFYGSYYSPWNTGYSPGFYGSFGYSWGSPYYGGYWGSGYDPYGWDPYYGYRSYGSYYGNNWGGYYGGYYGGGYYNNWGGNNVIIINDGSSRGVAYNKRPSRGGMLNSENAGNRTRSQIISRGDTGNSGGRVATSNSGRTQQAAGRQDEYYNRSWRRTSEATTNTNRSSWDNSSPTRTSNTNTRSTSDWNSGGSRPARTSTYEPSRSSGSFNTGGSRSGGGSSSSGSSSSGGGGGRTRSH